MTNSERQEKGKKILNQLAGGVAGEASLTGKVFPDFGKMTEEHLFGEVWSRPGLTLREREMITIAAIIALGSPSGLKAHMRWATNVGVSREEILEIIMHMAHYAGWPAAARAISEFNDLFAPKTQSQI